MADPADRIRETYLAAVQHDLVDLGDATVVGVVRRPPGWFAGAVDENVRALGPPESLLSETRARAEELGMAGLCEAEAHNAAWDETDFESRYRSHLRDSAAAQKALSELTDRVRGGESIALVCFESDDKRCHRRALQSVLRDRVAAPGDHAGRDG